MKNQGRLVVLALVALIWALSGAVGWAGDQEAGLPHFVYVIDEDIIPEHMETYMKARVADAKLSAQYNFEFPFLTFVQDFHVSTCGIFTAFAQIDGIPQKMEAYNERTGGKSKQVEKQAMPCVDTVSTAILVYRPDLSYVAPEPTFMPDFTEPFYQSVTIYYIKPDQYEKAEAVAKKVKALDQKKQFPMHYWVYERLIGQDVPAFVVVAQAKDKAAFVNLEAKLDAQPDEDVEKILADSLDVIKKVEHMEGTFVPEASYVPAGTFGQP
jgi:hypothetical protein